MLLWHDTFSKDSAEVSDDIIQQPSSPLEIQLPARASGWFPITAFLNPGRCLSCAYTRRQISVLGFIISRKTAHTKHTGTAVMRMWGKGAREMHCILASLVKFDMGNPVQSTQYPRLGHACDG